MATMFQQMAIESLAEGANFPACTKEPYGLSGSSGHVGPPIFPFLKVSSSWGRKGMGGAADAKFPRSGILGARVNVVLGDLPDESEDPLA